MLREATTPGMLLLLVALLGFLHPALGGGNNKQQHGFVGLNEQGDFAIVAPEGKRVLVNGVDVVAAVSQQQQEPGPEVCDVCQQQLEAVREELREEFKTDLKLMQHALCDAGVVDAFSVTQTFATVGAFDSATWSVDGEHFLAVAFLTSNRWASSYPTMQSPIFKWNNVTEQFVQIQTMGVSGAADWEPFVIDGVQYIALASFASGTITYVTSSYIYAWNRGTQQFVSHQSITTRGANDCTHFELNGDHYLAIANTRDGSSIKQSSVVYRWNRDAARFESFQSIATTAAYDWEAFVMDDGAQYLALASFTQSGQSPVFKFNNISQQFEQIQAFDTYNAYQCKHFQIGRDHYLAVTNYFDGQSYTLPSVIYKWNVTSQQFDSYQTITTNGATSWEHFVVDGVDLLVVGNQRDASTFKLDSVVYRWDTTTKQFKQFQPLGTVSAYHWHHFEIGATHYLFVSNGYDGSTRSTNSVMYEVSPFCV